MLPVTDVGPPSRPQLLLVNDVGPPLPASAAAGRCGPRGSPDLVRQRHDVAHKPGAVRPVREHVLQAELRLQQYGRRTVSGM